MFISISLHSLLLVQLPWEWARTQQHAMEPHDICQRTFTGAGMTLILSGLSFRPTQLGEVL